LYRHICVVMLLAALICHAGSLTAVTQAATEDSTSSSAARIIDSTDFPSLYLTEPSLQGQAIWMLQARLQEIGYEIQPSGIYDASTSHTVSLFQLANGLEADGVVNKEEWLALLPQELDASHVTTSAATTDKMLIVIDVKSRTLVLYKDKEVVCKYPVAVGKSSTPTPLGEWRVVHKSLGWGGGFGSRWMGLNVPWGIYGIHGTNKPGSIGTYASHGCIRMFNSDVEKLFPLVPHGCRVKIVNDGSMTPQQMKPVKMKNGSSGQAVVYVQARLKELGLEFGAADGRYGNMTELAVKYFQVWNGLNPSGEMDEATYRKMGLIK
jgi:peptidoglycan hydrolase-like protein with peptidoglycan-binding domain